MKNLARRLQLAILVLYQILVVTGCVSPTPDPLAGWHLSFSQDPNSLDKEIVWDYQNYIQKLPTEERNHVGPIFLFEDETGQRAVQIRIGLNGTSWEHILIYDKGTKRIRTIKYVSGHYSS
jgi:hypothetical protein